MIEEAQNASGGFESSSSNVYAEPKLNAFAHAMDLLIRSHRSGSLDYKVYICDEKVKIFNSNKNDANAFFTAHQKTTRRVVNYWCFCSGIALSELKALGARSIILTSGTLSPMEAMKDDIRLPFPISISNPHVIR